MLETGSDFPLNLPENQKAQHIDENFWYQPTSYHTHSLHIKFKTSSALITLGESVHKMVKETMHRQLTGTLSEESFESLTDVLEFMDPKIMMALMTSDLALYRDLQILTKRMQEGTSEESSLSDV